MADPHGNEKSMLEKVAGELISRLSLGNDVINYVRLAASANSVDIPMRGYDFSIDDFVRNILEEPTWLGTNPEDLRSRLSHAGSIAYLVDNAGEFQFDLLLIRRLSSMGAKVVVYARSRPYESTSLMTTSLTSPETLRLGHYPVITRPFGTMT